MANDPKAVLKLLAFWEITCDSCCDPWQTSGMTTTTGAKERGDLRVYEESVRSERTELIAGLRDLLGPKLVAYLGSVKETRAVRQWAEGERSPSQAVIARLRVAYQVAALLREKDAAPVVQAWFQGMNPRLDDISPARALREQDLDEAGPAVLSAARAFAAES